MKFKKKKNVGGFTLIEMLIAMFVFSLIVGTISGLFITGIRSQRRTLASQRLLDQTSYTLEYMSRALRMAKKDETGTCIGSGNNYKAFGSSLRFINHLEGDDCQEFFLGGDNGEQLMQSKENGAKTFALTSDKLQIKSLNFYLQGEFQGDMLQPKVTIALGIKWKGLGMGNQPKINIQTTISQRNLDTQ